MTHQERQRFIRQELKGLWPQWSPTEAEVRLWIGVLAPYSYDLARRALGQSFCEKGGNYRRPLPAGFLTKARLLGVQAAKSNQAVRAQAETNVFLECIEPPAWNRKRLGVPRPLNIMPRDRQSDIDYVKARAEYVRKQFERLYGGRWITVVRVDERQRVG